MKRLWQKLMLFDKVVEGGGNSGGSSGGSLLSTSSSGGGSEAPAGQQGTGTDAGKGAHGTGTTNDGTGAKGGTSTDWRQSIPTELQDHQSLKKFSDIGGLAGAYVNLEKLIGNEKIPVPGKHATEEDWKNVYKKLGLPELDKYKVEFDEGTGLDKEFISEFTKLSHDIGLLPHQANKYAKWMSAQSKAADARVVEMRKEHADHAKTTLQKEWGNDFQVEMQRTVGTLKRLGDEKFQQFVEESGLGNNVDFIKFLNKVGKAMYSEDKEIMGIDRDGNRAMSPSEALQKARSIMTDMKSPYHVKDHPNHKSAVKEVQDLFNVAYNQKSS